MSVFFILPHTTEGGTTARAALLSRLSYINSHKMRASQHLVIVAIEVEIIRLVKVRAYKRVRFGKIERVRSHYRRY